MADSYTGQGLTKPEPGGSLNTWGSKLNVVIDMFDAMNKFAGVTINGDTTVTFTNASAAATALPLGLKLVAGTVAANFLLEVPAQNKTWIIINTTNYTATVKPSGGTGVTVTAGGCMVCSYSNVDGDVINASSNRPRGNVEVGGTLTATGTITAAPATAGTHLTTLQQVSSLIAAMLTSGDGSMLVRVDDTTRKFLDTALTVSGSLVKTIVDTGGGNLAYNISFTETPFDEGNNVLVNGVLAI